MFILQNRLTVNSIFDQYASQYLKKIKTSYYQQKIIQSIIDCRSEALGGRVEECELCGHKVTLYNSCRNRHCPQCQFMKKEKWILEKESDLLPYQYFHAVFTLPHQLNPIVLRNKKMMYKLLFDTVKVTLNNVCENKKYFGAKIGYFSILHTWGQKLNFHPHLHCVIPGGGYRVDKKKWKESSKDFLVPIKVLRSKYQYYFLKALKQLYLQKELKLTGTCYEEKKHFQSLIDELFTLKWVVYLKESFKTNQSVIKYLSRYTHKIAISNNRIKKLKNDEVYFEYRDYARSNQKYIKKISALSFMRLFMMHIVPKRFVRIRYYGLLSCRTKEKSIQNCYEYYDKKRIKQTIKLNWKEVYLKVLGQSVDLCNKCGKGYMVLVEVIKTVRSPP